MGITLVSHAYKISLKMAHTVLSRASAHGRSQLKHQKLGVGVYTEEVLEWFNCPHASAHPGCEVSCQDVPNQPASRLRPCFVEASPMVEKAVSCRKADRLVASLPSFHSVHPLQYCKFHAASEERCEQGYGQVFAKL